jgi:hypothetical protein
MSNPLQCDYFSSGRLVFAVSEHETNYVCRSSVCTFGQHGYSGGIHFSSLVNL